MHGVKEGNDHIYYKRASVMRMCAAQAGRPCTRSSGRGSVGTHVKVDGQGHAWLGGARLFEVNSPRLRGPRRLDGSCSLQGALLIGRARLSNGDENTGLVAQHRQVPVPTGAAQNLLHLADGRVALLVCQGVFEVKVAVGVGVVEVRERVVQTWMRSDTTDKSQSIHGSLAIAHRTTPHAKLYTRYRGSRGKRDRTAFIGTCGLSFRSSTTMPNIFGCTQAQHKVNDPSESLSDELKPFSHVPQGVFSPFSNGSARHCFRPGV